VIEAAEAVSRTRDTYLAAQYQRLRIRRGANNATTAVTPSMLVAAWHMLHTAEIYTDRGPDYDFRGPCRRGRGADVGRFAS